MSETLNVLCALDFTSPFSSLPLSLSLLSSPLFLPFLSFSLPPPLSVPLLSHSAGVGRTGCFITLDYLLQHIEDNDWVDIFGIACEMRQHRNHMIQTEVNC